MKVFTDSLRAYRERTAPYPEASNQAHLVERFLSLAEQGPDALLRSHSPGHFTGSLLVANRQMDRVLLTLHRKLGMWLQLGGHADGDADLHGVAMREGEEESGLSGLTPFALKKVFPSEATDFPIFDLDIHGIPAHKSEPAHDHYDVRYLALVDDKQPFVISAESKDLRWIPLEEAYRLTTEWSMHRQFDKLSWLKNTWAP